MMPGHSELPASASMAYNHRMSVRNPITSVTIVVEGCVGVGKTTVASGLASHRGSKSLFEAFENNPFLRAFYEDPEGNAIETEFTFLLLHFHQIKNHLSSAGNSELVADFHLGKDLLYAD